mgnify:CR=1 FL=1
MACGMRRLSTDRRKATTEAIRQILIAIPGHGASHRISVGKAGVPEYACEAAVELLLLRVGEMELYDIDPLM